MAKFQASPLKSAPHSKGCHFQPSGDFCSFTIISSFDHEWVKTKGIQSAVNSDPTKSVCITDDVKTVPSDEIVCILPYEIADETKTITKSNFKRARWVAVDIDNDKLPDDEKWSQNDIFNFYSKQNLNFHLFGSPTDGNFKAYLETELNDSFDEYSKSTKAANTQIEGLGDEKYQGRVTLVKGYIASFNGGELFKEKSGEKTACVVKTNSKRVSTPPQKTPTRGKMSIYLKMLKIALIDKMTIKGKVLQVIPRPNGTFTLVLADEVKSKGSYWINPENSMMIHKAGGGHWEPREFFIDDDEQKEVFKLMVKIGSVEGRIEYFIEHGYESEAIEELSMRKIKLTEKLEKSGAVKKTTWKGGVRRVYFLFKQVRYFLNRPLEILKLLTMLKGSIFPSFVFSKKSSKHVQCLSSFLSSFHKGRIEDKKETTEDDERKKRIEETFKKYKQEMEEFREMRCG